MVGFRFLDGQGMIALVGVPRLHLLLGDGELVFYNEILGVFLAGAAIQMAGADSVPLLVVVGHEAIYILQVGGHQPLAELRGEERAVEDGFGGHGCVSVVDGSSIQK